MRSHIFAVTFVASGLAAGSLSGQAQPPAEAASSPVFADIQKQLGLKLDADRTAVTHLVVDRLEPPTDD